MRLFLWVALFCIGMFVNVAAKVRILTFHCSRPDFIEIQYLLFKKFLLDEFEIIVFNDAKDEEMAQMIWKSCSRLNIPCIRYMQSWHLSDPLNGYLRRRLQSLGQDLSDSGSLRHCHVIQYALDHYGYMYDDVVVICDGDAFPVRPLSLETLLTDVEVLGATRAFRSEDELIDYLWVIFIAFRPSMLPDLRDFQFHMDFIRDHLHDTGSHSYHYLDDHPSVNVQKYDVEPTTRWVFSSVDRLQEVGFTELERWLIHALAPPEQFQFTLDRCVFHFGNISGYSMDNEEWKLEIFKKYVYQLLKEPTHAGVWGNGVLGGS